MKKLSIFLLDTWPLVVQLPLFWLWVMQCTIATSFPSETIEFSHYGSQVGAKLVVVHKGDEDLWEKIKRDFQVRIKEAYMEDDKRGGEFDIWISLNQRPGA
jgi:hypothetical protein